MCSACGADVIIPITAVAICASARIRAAKGVW
jgi:hypothetical protein